MSRRERPPRRAIQPDYRYNSELVARFINCVMHRGKRSVATKIVYTAFDQMGEKTHRHPLEVFSEAMRNVSPLLEVKPHRVGGATYQVPLEVTPDRQVSLAIRWLIRAAQARPGKSMVDKLADEFVDASQGQGAAARRREETHRMAEANRAFAHYRW